jgi:hypothetical protein
MVPHEKRLASYLIDEPGLVEKSVKEAVTLKEEGNRCVCPRHRLPRCS